MLLLEVDSGERLVQGFVRLRWPAADRIAAGDVADWVNLFVRSALLWNQMQPLSAALRLTARPGEPLASVHSFVVPKQQEARLRLVLAAFLRSAGPGNADADVPHDEADLPGNFTHCDEARLIIGYERLQAGNGIGIHYNLRLADRLPRLAQTLIDLGAPVSYEAQVTPWALPRELLRPVLYDAARMEAARSAPRELVADQMALAERLKRAAQQRPSFHVEECLSTSPELLDALSETTTNLLAETVYGSLGVTPRLVQLTADEAEPFCYHVHSHLMRGQPDPPGDESVASAATKDEVDRLLCCGSLMPGNISTNLREPPGGSLFRTLSVPPSTSPGPRGLPAGGGGALSPAVERPYLFISYARRDGETVYPLVEELARRGVAAWIDRRIIGGEDWVAELENRLINCVGVIALISPAFVASKYCVREVHFADALNRPVLPVSVAAGVELGRGLRFILNSVQIINFHDTGAIEPILDAIDRHTKAGRTPPQ
jgi:hypothetical protein